MSAEKPKNTLVKTILWRILLTVGIMCVIYVGFQKRLGGQDDLLEVIREHFRQIRYDRFILAILIYHVACLLGTFRIFLIMRSQDIFISFGKLLKNLYIGLLFNPLLMGATGGDVIRSYYLTKETGKKAEVVTVVFLDRFVGISVLVSIAVMALIANISDPKFTPMLAPVGFFFIFLIIFAGLASSRRVMTRFRFLKRLIKHNHLIDIGKRSFETLNRAKKQFHVIFWAGLCTLGYQSMMIFSAWVAMTALTGIPPIALKHFFLFLPIIFTISAVPISLGGLGVGEALYAGCFAYVGVAEADAITISLINRIILMIAAGIGGGVYMTSVFEPYHAEDEVYTR